MLLSRFALAIGLVAAASAVRADDTADFLEPKNWEGLKDLWTIKGSTIIGETKEDPKFNTFLCSKAKYGDFKMSFKVTLREGAGNSGIQIRSEVFDAAKFRVKGPQADIGQQYWGSLYGENVGGMMKASPADLVKKVVKQSEENSYEIIAKGTKVTITINGTVMVDDDFKFLPGDPKKKDAPKVEAPKEGIVAFQIHAGFPKMKVEFTDIKFEKK